MEKNKEPPKLDYSLQTPEERNELVKKIISETPSSQLTNKYLEILSDYIIFAMDKEERKQKKILTDNRMVTVNKRETSFQRLADQFDNGEDGIYNMITNDKNIIFMPKTSITQKDIEEIPVLKNLKEAIEQIEKQESTAVGKKKFLLKKQLIEMRKDQYIIKDAYNKPIYFNNNNNNQKNFLNANTAALNEEIILTPDGEVKSNGSISLFEPSHVSMLLCNYSKLKEESYGKFWTDAHFLMEDLDNLIDTTLKKNYPHYYDLLIYKIDGKQNIEIQSLLNKKHKIKYSIEYISSLWRNKIPKMLAEKAQEDYIIWYYTTQERGKWKKCSRCGQVKLADNRFFSKNKTSKDGFYSICKECRNKKRGKVKDD